MLFFGSKCDRLCMLQFALISLIPGLIQHLEDCADPELDSYERNLSPPSSLRTSDRQSRRLQSLHMIILTNSSSSLYGITIADIRQSASDYSGRFHDLSLHRVPYLDRIHLYSS